MTLRRCSPISTCTCSGKGRCSAATRSSGPNCAKSTACVGDEFCRLGAECAQASASSATSTIGTAAAIRCSRHATGGVWELFVPELEAGEKYKFRIGRRSGASTIDKSDPYGFAAELPPCTAVDRYRPRRFTPGTTANGWTGGPTPTSSSSRSRVYEVHLGSLAAGATSGITAG